jgi:hypothetical protein
MSLAKILTAAATVVAVLATPFVTANAAHAKSVKCYSKPVAGTIATRIWTCSTVRI